MSLTSTSIVYLFQKGHKMQEQFFMSDLQNTIKNFSDEYLLEQYTIKKDDYTDHALSLMEEEISRRNLSCTEESSLKNDRTENTYEDELAEYTFEDFVPIIHSFYKKEVLLARDILIEENIPGLVKPSNSSDNNGVEVYSIYVPEDMLEQTQECIQKYFIESEGFYFIKYNDTTDRLKAFNFHELQFSNTELDEIIDVEFSAKESGEILHLIKQLIADADRIEATGKILFYYDNLNACESHFSSVNSARLTRSDLLTVLEVLQTYCEETTFSSELLNTAKALLDFLGI